MEIIFTILYTIAFTYTTALIDYEHISKKEYIKDHKSRFLQRFIAFIPLVIINPYLFLAGGFLFYLLFDTTLNYLRQLGLFYIGNTALSDKFFRKHPLLLITTKLITLLFITLFFYLSCN